MTSEAAALDNDPANGCVGCGPSNPMGLRLAFRRAGDAVEGTLATTAAMQGWPGRVHSGLLYLALLETANWTLYGLLDKVGVPAATTALEVHRWVPTGEVLTLAGRLVAQEPRTRVRAEARGADGGVVAALERDFVFPTRAAFLRRMGYAEVPAVLEGAFPG